MQRFFFLALLVSIAACTSRGTVECTASQSSCAPAAGGAAVCVDTMTDPSNCGRCRVACTAGQMCSRGACTAIRDSGVADFGPGYDGGPRPDAGIPMLCMPTCSSGQRCCGTECIGLVWAGGAGTDGTRDTSFLNCGDCGRACDPNTANRCAMGSVGPACECGGGPACTGGQNCVNSGTAYVCQANCGGMGPCATGTQCCGGMTGTCVSTMTDNANCGTCGHTCTSAQSCQRGACVDLCGGVACRVGAGTDLGEICCADACVAVDDNNCGGCGTMCDTAGGDACTLATSFGGSAMTCCTPMGFPFCVPGDGGFPFP